MYSVVFFGYLDPDVLSYAESSQLPLPEETPSSSVPAQHEAAGMTISKTESRDLGLAVVFKWIMGHGGHVERQGHFRSQQSDLSSR